MIADLEKHIGGLARVAALATIDNALVAKLLSIQAEHVKKMADDFARGVNNPEIVLTSDLVQFMENIKRVNR